ncbi:MAG TPA: hypothetical protein PLX14_12565 [Anaerolineales bacterium]|nr:hypothetical protein [Anaerolineales bacterium]HNE02999.1 hypothetical protein [Anaerolineales bacterium]
MEGIKIYVLIEDKENEAEIRIDGNLETLRGLIYILYTEIANSANDNTVPTQSNKVKQEDLVHAVA